MADVLLETRNLTKRFGGLIAVSGLDFQVERGSIAQLDRAQRRGQDHGVQRHYRNLPARRRVGRLRRPGHRGHEAPRHRRLGHRPHVSDAAPVRHAELPGKRHGVSPQPFAGGSRRVHRAHTRAAAGGNDGPGRGRTAAEAGGVVGASPQSGPKLGVRGPAAPGDRPGVGARSEAAGAG